MKAEKKVFEALVRMNACPGTNGADECCGTCSHRTAYGHNCQTALFKECRDTLSRYLTGPDSVAPVDESKDVAKPSYEKQVADIFAEIGVPTMCAAMHL